MQYLSFFDLWKICILLPFTYIKMKNHSLIQNPPKVKQKIHEIYGGELGKDGYESKKGA